MARAKCNISSKVYKLREELIWRPLWVNDREGVNWNEDLVSFAMNSDRIVIVLLSLFDSRSELDVYVLRDTRWYHAFLIVLNFKEVSLRRKNVDSLRGWGIVNQTHFQRVGLACFKSSELNHAGAGLENAIWTYEIVDVIDRNGVSFVRFCFG